MAIILALFAGVLIGVVGMAALAGAGRINEQWDRDSERFLAEARKNHPSNLGPRGTPHRPGLN